MPKYLSGRSKLTPQSELQSDRYRYLSIENAEPNLGDPVVGPSSVGAKPVVAGQQYIIVSVQGDTPGERYWIPNQGGIIPGSISVFDEGTLVGTLSSITQLNFVGAAVTASVSIASSNLATIRVFAPGNNQEILFNTTNEFSTSSKLKFDSSTGLLSAGDRLNVGAGGTVITTTGIGSVGIGTTNPTQELHVQGDLRLTGTIYDYFNQPGNTNDLLVKNNLGGLTWTNQTNIRAGAGGTYKNVQFHNSTGVVDGAPNFVFDDVNSRVGVGSTQPQVLFDVLGISSFNGGTTIDNLNVTGVTTTQNLTATNANIVGFLTGTNASFTGIVTASKFVGALDANQLYVTGISTLLQKVNIGSDLGVSGLTTTQNLQVYQSTTLNRLNVTGISTVGFLTGTSAFFSGIVTATKFVGELNVSQLYVTGISTFLQKVNINSDLGVTGLTTTQNLQVYQSTTLNRLNVTGVSTFTSQLNANNLSVTGVGTFDNIKLDTNTVSTNSGNLILDSSAGITQINDAVYVNDTTESTSKDNGSIITEGGVGIEKNLNVGGSFRVLGVTTLAANGGITTTGGDLYVGGNLYLSQDIYQDEIFARNGFFTGIVSTKDLLVSGISTFLQKVNVNSDLGVTGFTTLNTLKVSGISTFDGLLDANAGATIDNVRIGVSGDNEIDTSTGNLTIDSAGGLVTIDDGLLVTGVTTLSSLLDANAGATIDNIRIGISGDNEIDTSTGNLTIYSAGGTTTLADIVNITGNLSVSGVATFSSNVFIGDSNTDKVSFAATVDSNIIPSGSRDLGSSSNKWNTVYANTVVGQFSGNADSASQVSSGTTTGTSSYYLTFVDSNNSTRGNEYLYTDAEISYNPSTDLLNLSKIYVSGISTFDGLLDANGGATIDNVQIGISGDNEIDTSTGNLTIDSAGGLVTIDDQLSVTGISTFLQKVNVNSDLGVTGFTTLNTLKVSGISTFDGLLDANGGAYIDNVQIGISGDNEIDTSTGNLTIDSAGGLVTIDDNVDVTGYLIVTGISTFKGNVTIGDANTDKVSFGATVDSNIIPSGSRDLGSSSNKWNNVYANTFVGTITGNADTASQVAVVTTSTNATHYLTFVDSNNSPFAYESLYTDAGISYNPSTDLLNINKIYVSGISTFVGLLDANSGATIDNVQIGISGDNEIDTSTGNLTIDSAGGLVTIDDNVDVTGYLIVTGISTFKGNVTIGDANTDKVSFGATVDSNIIPSGTTRDLGSSTNKWNNVYANNFSGTFIGNADTASQVAVVTTSTNATHYLTFVDSNNSPFAYESLYTDAEISYNPSTNLLNLSKIYVSGISTFDGLLDANAGATIDNVRIGISGDNEIDTSTGNLTIDSAGGLVTIDDNVDVTGYLIVSGISTFQGNVTIGDANTDKVSFGATVDSNIIPSGSRDLGSSSNKWNNVYANNFSGTFIGNADTASQVAVVTTSTNATHYLTFVDSNNTSSAYESLYTDAEISYNPSTDLLNINKIYVSGISTFVGLLDANSGATIDNVQIGISGDNEIDTSTGNLTIDSAGGLVTIDDNANVTGNLVVSGISTFQGNVTIGDANTDKVSFGATVDSNIIPSGSRDLGSSSNRWNNVYANTFVGTITGNADTATKLATSRNFSIDGNNNTSINAGDVSATSVSFDGSSNVILRGFLKNVTGLSAGTYGNSTTIPVVSVNSQGIVTSITSTSVNFATATVANSDKTATISTSTNAPHYITFVDSDNNPSAYESLYTDAGISYNPSTNILSLTNLIVSGISTFQGNVTIGDANTDKVSFGATVDSNIIPSGSRDLGSSTNKWNNVYANTFVGAITGNADTASQVAVVTRSTNATHYLTFVDSDNNPSAYESLYTDAGISYNPSTNILSLTNLIVSGISTFQGNVTIGDANTDKVSFGATVDSNIIPSGSRDLGSSTNKWNNVYANTFVGAITGNADTATKLATSRNFSINGTSSVINAGDVSATSVSFDGSSNVILNGSLKSVTGLSAGTYGNSTTIPVVSVNSQGIVTSITSTGVNFTTATVANSDKTATISTSTNAPYFLTFVDSNNTSSAYESLYTDSGVTYNPSTNILSLTNLIVSGISTFQGNVTIGDANTDKVSFGATVDSNIIPSGTTRDLGSSSNRWNNVYANTFVGAITGNADTASQVSSGTTTGTSSYYLTFVDSNNTTRGNEYLYTDAEISYNPSTNILSLTNLIVSGISTFQGNVTIGDANTDKVSFGATVDSNIIPSGTTRDLGSSTNKWNNVYANTFVGTITGNADTATYATNAGIATNLKGGIASQIPYQTAANTTAFIPNGTSGQLLQSNGASAPSWVNPGTLSSNFATNAGIATNLKGGIASQIPYQTAADTTAFIPNGSSGQLLQSNGTSAPSWVNPGSLTADKASYATRAGLATDLEINATNQLLYQVSNNNSSVLPQGTSGQLLQSNGASAPSWVNPGTLSSNFATNAGIATNLKGGSASQIPYQTAADTTAFIPNGTSGQLLQSNGTSAPSWVNPGSLYSGYYIKGYATVRNDTRVSTTSTSFVNTGLSLTYNKLSTDSVILIMVTEHYYSDILNNVRLLRDSTVIHTSSNAFGNTASTNVGLYVPYSLTMIDSASGTGNRTYAMQFARNSATPGTIATNNNGSGVQPGYMTVLEIILF